ncbi:HAD family hydrolase [Actinomadura rupiterrae]|uniref:HAD family hydrolase n=1 Tax=Actinomadura rupiterrae TaxID=559627 RepID=UPI0020A3D9CE|nr:HAD family phosphatase [Actinomadura rupiterrae]MCP2335278.1 sugar-phosphatase [Actinomadura rupiterrae]
MELIRLPARAAVFDLDGTLIDTEPRNRVMWARLFDAHGAPHDEALLASFAGRRGREALVDHLHLFPGRTAEELFHEVLGYGDDPDLPVPDPVPGAVELVRELHALGVPTAVVTSGMRGYAHGLLADLGVRELLKLIVTADDVVVGKPDPEGFLAAARGLGVPPHEAVAFEDAPAGVAAARDAGMTVVGITTTQPSGALSAAHHVVADLRQVTVTPGPELRIRDTEES